MKEINNLPDNNFNVIVLKMLIELGRKMSTVKKLQQREGKYKKVPNRSHRAKRKIPELAGNGQQSLYQWMKIYSKHCCEREEKARGTMLRDKDPLLFFAPTFIGPSG